MSASCDIDKGQQTPKPKITRYLDLPVLVGETPITDDLLSDEANKSWVREHQVRVLERAYHQAIHELEALRSSASSAIPQLGVKDPRPCVHAIGATTCGYPQEHRIHEGSAEPAPPAGRHLYTPPVDETPYVGEKS